MNIANFSFSAKAMHIIAARSSFVLNEKLFPPYRFFTRKFPRQKMKKLSKVFIGAGKSLFVETWLPCVRPVEKMYNRWLDERKFVAFFLLTLP